MAKWSNSHRRRLHVIQNEQQRSENAALVTFETRDDLPSSSPVPAFPHPPPQSASNEVPASNEVQNELCQNAKSPQDDQRSFSSPGSFSHWNFMNSLRHILALGILFGFGYLYSQHQQAKDSADSKDNVSNAAPFANWEDIAEAPSFNSSNVSMTEQAIPSPITIDEGNSSDLSEVPAGLASWLENEPVKEQQQTPVVNHTASVSETKKHSLSLWDEPGLARTPEDKKQIEEKMNSVSNTVTETMTNTVAESITSLATDSPIPKTSRPDTPAVSVNSWRQFTLGSGKKSTVCVVDETVSNDTLLLSTIFAGVRQKWTSGQSGRPEQRLVLLIENPSKEGDDTVSSLVAVTPNSLQKKQQLQQKIAVINPERVIYLSRGNDKRGQLSFSSEQESIAALMSVPGMYRLASEVAEKQFSNKNTSTNREEIHIELPSHSLAQEAVTTQLLFSAISGEWVTQEDKNRTRLPSSLSELSKKATGYLASRDVSKSSTSSLDSEILEPVKKKRKVEILPSPSAYRQQTIAKKSVSRNSFFKLPPPPIHQGR